MLRYFEAEGEVRRALSVVKKRSGAHEHAIREFRLAQGGLIVGPPLKDFRGIFTGTPTYVGEAKPLMSDPDNGADSLTFARGCWSSLRRAGTRLLPSSSSAQPALLALLVQTLLK